MADQTIFDEQFLKRLEHDNTANYEDWKTWITLYDDLEIKLSL